MDDDHEHGRDCGCPTGQQLREMIDHNVATTGRQLLSIADDPLFIYTIGNALKGHPELLVIGFGGPHIAEILNLLSDEALDADKPWVGGQVHMPPWVESQTLRVKFVTPRYSVREEYTIQAGQYLGREDYPVLQVVLSDGEGRFPGDPLCDKDFSHQVLVGAN